MLYLKRYNLFDYIPIDLWEKIALYVQFLELSDKSDEEFEKNLISLQNSLLKNGIRFEFGKRCPNNYSQVGLATLLENIYNSCFLNSNVKYNFFEQISTLKKLGVNDISLRGTDYGREEKLIMYNEIQDDFFSINKDDYHSSLNKLYTDGEFELKKDILYYYVCNINNANYFLNINLSFDNRAKCCNDIDKFSVVLNSFNGIYPEKDFIISKEYPMIDFYSYDECANKDLKVRQYLKK